MKIENQVCTLVQAKKLHELGIEQFNTFFAYCLYCPDPTGEKDGFIELMGEHHPYNDKCEHIADAYTVAELGVMLPVVVNTVMVIASYGWRISNNDNFRVFIKWKLWVFC